MNSDRLDYGQFIREANSFNQQLVQARGQRLPFIDAQTGIAQGNCSLWHDERDRDVARSGAGGHLYSYPAYRWHKRRREYLMKWTPRHHSQQQQQQQLRLENSLLEEQMGDHPQNHNPIERTASSSSSDSSTQSSGNHLLIGAADLPLRKSSRSLLSSSAPCSRQQKPTAHRQVVSISYIHSQQQPPSRADSTGTHSFVDSDSRDQSSSATSHSLAGDSPQSHHQLDDEPASHLCELGLELLVQSNQDGDEDGPQNDGEHKDREGDETSRQSAKLRKRCNLKATIERVSFVSTENCRGESPSRNSKNCTSILVKNNGHKTTSDNNPAAKIKTAESISPRNGSHEPTSLFMSPELEPIEQPANLRQHACTICDQTYKTRPGLSYHFLHVHDAVLPKQSNRLATEQQHSNKPPVNGGGKPGEHLTEKLSKKRSRTLSQGAPTTRVLRNNRGAQVSSVHTSSNDPLITEDDAIIVGVSDCISPDSIKSDNSKSNDTIIESEQGIGTKDQTHPVKADAKSLEVQTKEAILERKQNGTTITTANNESRQNLFCDFCLGTTEKNRRTRQPEELISCSNCGSSGHPSCLQFSDNIRQSVQRYNWQCIDCKTCSTCGKPDQEDQLLFCDDCDRSYHTFCLSPRLENLPEGNWTCKLCLNYYYNK